MEKKIHTFDLNTLLASEKILNYSILLVLNYSLGGEKFKKYFHKTNYRIYSLECFNIIIEKLG